MYILSSVIFFNDTATTEIYTLSLHDALPISSWPAPAPVRTLVGCAERTRCPGRISRSSCGCSAQWSSRLAYGQRAAKGSEEHTSELQSRQYLVSRLLLAKKAYFPPNWWTRWR